VNPGQFFHRRCWRLGLEFGRCACGEANYPGKWPSVV
jgi:hypothetical protein